MTGIMDTGKEPRSYFLKLSERELLVVTKAVAEYLKTLEPLVHDEPEENTATFEQIENFIRGVDILEKIVTVKGL